jgi:long-chain acyl-CoA synthetase
MILELKQLTIPALLTRSFTLYRGLPAIGYVGEPPLTYAEVQKQTITLAASLLGLGIREGDKVAILGENSPQWVLAYLAITSIGAVVVPILPGFGGADARHIIRSSESVAVFVTAKQRPKFEDAEMADVHAVLSLEDFEADERRSPKARLMDKAKHLFGRKDGGSLPRSEALKAIPSVAPDDLAAIIYTSGTTGHSKGVMLTHRNIVSDVVGSIEKFPIDSRDRFLSVLPLSHTYEATGGMLCPLAAGVSIFYLKGLPTSRKLLSAMQTVKPTGILTVPMIVDKIYRRRVLGRIKSKRLDWLYRIPFLRRIVNKAAGKTLVRSLGGSLRFFMFGGAVLNQDLELFLRDAGISYSTGYGMTEASPILTINPFGKVRVGSCGQAIPSVEMRILHPDPATGVGEIIVKGPNIMKGYFKNEEASRRAFMEEGWLRTGDLGYLDSDGYLYIKGRAKNVIVDSSGENIYPEIIEQQLQRSPYIQQAIVYRRGGRLIAKAYLDPDVLDPEFEIHKLSDSEALELKKGVLEQIRVQINQRLPAFSTIQEIVEQPEPFEMTPTKKLKRYLYVPKGSDQ